MTVEPTDTQSDDAARDERARRALAAGDGAGAAAEWAELARRPGASAEVFFRLGVAERLAGNADAALRAYEAAVARDGSHADARNNLGNLLVDLGRAKDAVAHLEAACARRPGHAPTLNNLAAARLKAGDIEGAVAGFRDAVARAPAYAAGHNNLGAALREAKRPAEAAAAFRRALALDPAHAEAWSNLANAFADDGDLAASLEASAKALALAPTAPGALAGRADALRQLDRLDEASVLARAALAVRPDHAEALNTLGIILNEQGRHAEAADAFRRASARRRPFVDAEVNLAMTLLAAGDFKAGFEAYEARWRRPASPPRGFTVPGWTGKPLEGRSILLHTEQGLGDAIQFIRFAPEVARRGGRVVVECQKELARLFAGVRGVSAVVARFGALPPVACEAPLMSLPRLLGTTLKTLDGAPYLAPHPELVARFARQIEPLAAGRLKVGLVWAGNPKNGNDRRRSIAPALFGRFAAMTGVAFFSLQKGWTEALPSDLCAVDLAPALDDLADAAAAMRALDLVVTVDTALAHLAGAIGKRALVLLPAAPDWRWLRRREDTPWYRSLRLVRQAEDAPGDWDGPLYRVGEEIGRLARTR